MFFLLENKNKLLFDFLFLSLVLALLGYLIFVKIS